MSYRLHIYKSCHNEFCQSKRDKSLGNIWGDPLHDIHVEDGHYFSTCSICKQVVPFRDPNHKAKLRYPQLNMSTGEVFKSRDEETAYAKKHKLEAVS